MMCIIYCNIVFSTERFFWNSYRKLAWVRVEPTTTEFRSDALTDWAIMPWVQLALRANFVQLLSIYLHIQLLHLYPFFLWQFLIWHHSCYNMTSFLLSPSDSRTPCKNKHFFREYCSNSSALSPNFESND